MVGAVVGAGLVGGVLLVHSLVRGAEISVVSVGLAIAMAGAAVGLSAWGAGRLGGPDAARLRALAEALRATPIGSATAASLADPHDEEPLTDLVVAIQEAWDAATGQLSDLRSQGDVLRSLLEASPSGVLITGSDGRIRYLNATFRSLVRLSVDPIGRLPIEAVPVVEVQTTVDRGLSGEPSRDVACGSDPYELLLQAVPLVQGGVLVLAQDVTQFRLAERARTDFVANVSHELRTPLTAILGFAETLLDDADHLPADAAHLLERVYRNARRLRDLFEDLLTLSRIEARRGVLPITEQSLRPILAEALASAADLAHEQGQSFELKCKRSRTAQVNPEALTTIVSNLVVNACHYTPEGGAITVSVHDDAGEVRIDVVDNGIGIDPAHHQRIFERFYRVDEGRSRRKGGTGLGLAIVKHMAMASGARIALTSEHGKGSTFSLYIPR